MTLKTILLSAASALVLSAGAASAAPATAESAVNVRSGPGTQYQVIGTIPGGATVDVGGCSANWCQVSFNGETGYSSQSYLSVAEGRPAIVAPSYAYDDTPYYDNYYDDGYGYEAGVGLYVNPGHRFQHGWNGGHRGWNGGHASNGGGRWQGRTGWNGNPGGNRPNVGGGMNRSNIGGRPSMSAPVGMPTGGGGGVFRGGAGVGGGMRAGGGAIGGGGHTGGGGHIGGGAIGGGGAGGPGRH